MFKRTRWLATGYAVGIGTSVYAAYKARQVARRYTPPEVAQRAADSASRGADRASRGAERVRDALAEGRAAMQEREAELRLKHSR